MQSEHKMVLFALQVVVSWGPRIALIEPHGLTTSNKGDRSPCQLAPMLRTHLSHQW